MINADIIARLRDAYHDFETLPFEEILSVSQDFYDPPSTLAYDLKWNEYFAKYDQCVHQLQLVLGKPDFNDGMGNELYPEWYESDMLAYWSNKEGAVYIAFRQDDKELPFIIVCGYYRKGAS